MDTTNDNAQSVAKIIFKYFTGLTDKQKRQFEMLDALYRDWNDKINVISRKDIGNLYEHHVLHSLGIAEVINFRPGTKVLDVGTGGGFPGIPLAIMFPEVEFLLIDGIGKKIRVAQDVINKIGLTNAVAVQRNAMEEKGKFDFVVSRAVKSLVELERLVHSNISNKQKNALPNGIICLKGGDVSGEVAPFKNINEVWELSNYFTEEFFETKKVVYISVV